MEDTRGTVKETILTTCYTHRGCSVVDYAIASADIQHRVADFRITPLKLCSDHCPLMLTMIYSNSYKGTTSDTAITKCPGRHYSSYKNPCYSGTTTL